MNPLSLTKAFDGATATTADTPRLNGQLQAVYDTMSDGQWYSIENLSQKVAQATKKPVSQTSISARIRDLRKAKFGGYNVERQKVSDGLYEYRIAR